MGKSLKSSEQSAVQIQDNNPGCMWGMFHILDYHHWRVKKVFPHKKKRHARYKRNTISHEQQQDVVAEAEPLLVTQHGEKLNATASGECALHLEKDGSLNHKPKDANKLSRDISVKFKKNSDVLEIISVEKKLLLKFLQDIDNGGNKSRRASRNKARLTKSGSFPLTASSQKRNISSSSSRSSSAFRNKQNEIWAFPKGEKFLVGTQAPKKFGSSSVKDKKPKPSVTDSGVEQKPNISLKSSEGLNHKGWNQLVLHQFKVIKQKIKHALVEFRKSDHHHTSIEDIPNKASTESSNDNKENEISEILYDGVIREYRKSKSLSEGKVSDFDSNKHEIRLMRRTSSLHESLDKYTQLFERSLSKEVKWQGSKSKSLRLISEDNKIQKNGHVPMFSRSNFSMPNINFLGFILHEALLDTVETDTNDGQKKLVSLSSKTDKSLDQVNEAEIAEKVEGSGRDVGYESFPQEKVEASMDEVTLSLETSYQDNITSHAEGRELNTTLDELDSLPDSLSNTRASVTSKDINKSLDNHYLLFESDVENDSNFKYVKDVLEFSGFMGNDQMRYTVEQPLKPTLFKALEASLNNEKESSGEEIINTYDHHQLLFNLVNEVLFEIHEKSPSYFPRPFFFNHLLHPMPKGQYLLKEVWSSVDSYLSLRPELFQTLDDVVSSDLAKRSGWMNMNLQQEEEIVALELEEMIIGDLLDELVFSAYD